MTIQRSVVRSDSKCRGTSLTQYLSFQSSGSIVVRYTSLFLASRINLTIFSSLNNSIIVNTLNIIILLEVNRVSLCISIVLAQDILVLNSSTVITECLITVHDDIHCSYRLYQARDTTCNLLICVTSNLISRSITISMFFIRRLDSEGLLTFQYIHCRVLNTNELIICIRMPVVECILVSDQLIFSQVLVTNILVSINLLSNRNEFQ